MANRSDDLQAIDPDKLYPVELLKRFSGLGDTAIRELRRRGLVVKYLFGRAYCRGRESIEVVQVPGNDQKDG